MLEIKAGSASQDGRGVDDVEKEEPPFPYFHFSILLSAGFASGIALTGLFPYVSYMVVDLYGKSPLPNNVIPHS